MKHRKLHKETERQHENYVVYYTICTISKELVQKRSGRTGKKIFPNWKKTHNILEPQYTVNNILYKLH